MPSLSGTYGYLGSDEGAKKKKKKKAPSPSLGQSLAYTPPKPSKKKKRRVKKRLTKAVAKSKTISHPSLGPRQEEFVQRLAKDTKLDPSVLAGFAANEQPNDNPSVEGSDNWLNIGYFDSGPGAPTQDKRFFEGPNKAGKTTAKFFKGELANIQPGADIPEIIKTAGKSPEEQIRAIQTSGWASSGSPYIPELAAKTKVKQGKPVPTKLKQKSEEVLGKKSTQEILNPKAPKAPKQVKGPYGGSQRKALQALPKAIRDQGRNDSRTPEQNESTPGAAANSDHLTTNTNAYAADIPGTLEDGSTDRHAKKISKDLGMDGHRGINTVTKDGYRYSLIWQSKGHFDHIHLGVKWVGGGDVAPSGSGGGTPGGTTGGKPGTPGRTRGGTRFKKEEPKLYSNSEYYTVAKEHDEKRKKARRTREAVKQISLRR